MWRRLKNLRALWARHLSSRVTKVVYVLKWPPCSFKKMVQKIDHCQGRLGRQRSCHFHKSNLKRTLDGRRRHTNFHIF